MPKLTVYVAEDELAEIHANAASEKLSASRFLIRQATVEYRRSNGKTPSIQRQNDGIPPVIQRQNDGTGEYKGDPLVGSPPSVVKPHGGRPPATHEKGSEKTEKHHPGFDEFWAAYPKRCFRRVRSAALKRWDLKTPNLAVVLEALAWQDPSYADWQVTDDAGRYYLIEAPDVWLNQERWTRERPEVAAAPVATVNPHPCGHPDWLLVDRKSLGKTSANYTPKSREWSEHMLVETGRRPEPTPAVTAQGW